MSLSWKSTSLSQPVNFQTIDAKMRLPQGLFPGARRGAYSAPTPQLEKVGSHTTLDHPVEKSFPRHWLNGGSVACCGAYCRLTATNKKTAHLRVKMVEDLGVKRYSVTEAAGVWRQNTVVRCREWGGANCFSTCI